MKYHYNELKVLPSNPLNHNIQLPGVAGGLLADNEIINVGCC